jgi:hypothetical protein
MSSITSILSCDDCEKPIVVIDKSIGTNCVISLCTVCAKANVSTHDQGAIDDTRSAPPESMCVGVRVV